MEDVPISPERWVTVAFMKLVALAVVMSPGALIIGPLDKLVVVAVAVPVAGPIVR
jgi:hypothetical protein